MNELKFELKDYYDMLNLYKALLEAKFHKNPENKYVSGSPIIAKICNELVDILSSYEFKKNGSEKWTEWRKLKNQNYYKERIIELIANFGEWKKLNINEKKASLINYISPFTCTEGDLVDLIYEIDLKLK